MAPLSGEEMKVEVEERMDQMESNLSKYHRRADRLLLQLEKMKEVIEADAADRYPST
jgi:chaperonin cofactor prefoldin